MKCIINNVLMALFFIMYLVMIDFFGQYLPVHSSIGIVVGSLLAILTSFVLAMGTVRKIIDIRHS